MLDQQRRNTCLIFGGLIALFCLLSSWTHHSNGLDQRQADLASASLSTWARPGALLFVTLADQLYVEGFLAHTSLALRRHVPEAQFLVLCIDEGCQAACQSAGIASYAGYFTAAQDRNMSALSLAAYAKFNGLVDLLGAGSDVILFDGDVLINGDVMAGMAPLSDQSWDMQVQDNGQVREMAINIGWLFIRSSALTIQFARTARQLWQEHPKRWDQSIVNNLLRPEEGITPTFTSPQGVRVKILPTSTFRTWHEYEWKSAIEVTQEASPIMLHMFCPTNGAAEKLYLAGLHGFWQDVDSVYSKPPPMLDVQPFVAPETQWPVIATLLLRLAAETGRALLLPARSTFTIPWQGEIDKQFPRPFSRILSISHLMKHTKILEPLLISHSAAFVSRERHRQIYHNHRTLDVKDFPTLEALVEATALTGAFDDRIKLDNIGDLYRLQPEVPVSSDVVMCQSRLKELSGCGANPWCNVAGSM